MSAGMQGGGAEFGALFGFGGYGGRQFDPQRDLLWKPPGVEKVKKEEHWMFPKSAKRKEDIFETFLPPEPEVDAVEVSRVAFDKLLASKDVVLVEMKHLDDVFAFLESTQDEPEANNVHRFCKWLAERQASKQTSRALAAMVTSKIRLQTIPWEDLPEMLACLTSMDEKGIPTITKIIDTVPIDRVEAICARTTRLLSSQCSPKTKPSSMLLLWLSCLRRCPYFRYEYLPDSGSHSKDSESNVKARLGQRMGLLGGRRVNAFHEVHRILAFRFPDPAMLAPHLAAFSRENLCEILRRHWVPLLSAVKGRITPYHATKRLTFIDVKDRLKAVRADYIAMTKATDAVVEMTAGQAMRNSTTRRARGTVLPQQTCVIALLHAMQKNGIQHARLTRGIFTILQNQPHSGAPALFKLFRELQSHPTLGVPKSLPAPLVRYFLDCGSPAGGKLACFVFASSPDVPLKSCPDLALRLVQEDSVPSSAVWSILHRQTAEEFVPISERAQVKSSLLPERVDLMHLVALNFSRAEHITPRVAFRRVWECYRFLQDRGAPVSSIMTRAFVTAGITRYLQDYTTPPKAQVRYILRIVRDIEGIEVAEELDRTIFAVWKEKVYPAVIQQKWREQGKGDHLHQALEELKQVRFRTRLWALPKPQDFEKDGARHDQWSSFDEQKSSERRGEEWWESTAIEAAPTGSLSSKFEPQSLLPSPEARPQAAADDAELSLPEKDVDSFHSSSATITADALSSMDFPTTTPPPSPPSSNIVNAIPDSTSISKRIPIIQRKGLGYYVPASILRLTDNPTTITTPGDDVQDAQPLLSSMHNPTSNDHHQLASSVSVPAIATALQSKVDEEAPAMKSARKQRRVDQEEGDPQ